MAIANFTDFLRDSDASEGLQQIFRMELELAVKKQQMIMEYVSENENSNYLGLFGTTGLRIHALKKGGKRKKLSSSDEDEGGYSTPPYSPVSPPEPDDDTIPPEKESSSPASELGHLAALATVCHLQPYEHQGEEPEKKEA